MRPDAGPEAPRQRSRASKDAAETAAAVALRGLASRVAPQGDRETQRVAIRLLMRVRPGAPACRRPAAAVLVPRLASQESAPLVARSFAQYSSRFLISRSKPRSGGS